MAEGHREGENGRKEETRKTKEKGKSGSVKSRRVLSEGLRSSMTMRNSPTADHLLLRTKDGDRIDVRTGIDLKIAIIDSRIGMTQIAAVAELIFMPFSRFPSLTNQIECPHSPFLRHNYTNSI